MESKLRELSIVMNKESENALYMKTHVQGIS